MVHKISLSGKTKRAKSGKSAAEISNPSLTAKKKIKKKYVQKHYASDKIKNVVRPEMFNTSIAHQETTTPNPKTERW